MNTIEIEDRRGIQFCRRQAVAITHGDGVWVWDESGDRFLDMTGGWGVTCLGHSHPVITSVIENQARKLMQSPNSGFSYSPERARLLEVLGEVLPGKLSRMYFVNSGAEANDAAIKLARKITGRSKLVATNMAFHGRTHATLSATGGADVGGQFPTVSRHTRFVPYGDFEAMAKVIDDETAAVIVEPIQGEGGIRIPPGGYLADIKRLCLESGAKLIIDEIQTGFCRTGSFFALEQELQGVDADFMTMGKGIAGGFPFAAIAVSEEVNGCLQLGDHGGTYAGNPLGCAVAATVIQYLKENDVAGKAKDTGKLLGGGLERLARRFPGLIRQVRGRGLMQALQLNGDEQVTKLTQFCLDAKLLVTPTRNGVIRFLPSLLISSNECDEALERLGTALERMTSTGQGSCDRLQRSVTS